MENPKPFSLSKEKEQAYLLYAIFCGDAVKTAHALGVQPAVIIALAKTEGWDSKVSELAELRTSNKPGDLERAINRAVNFAQAHKMRQELQRVLDEIAAWSPAELKGLMLIPCMIKGAKGSMVLTTRPFADLTAALEKAHTLTYLALGDTAQDRSRRKEDQDESVLAASAMHAQLAKSMAAIASEPGNQAATLLLEEQMRQASGVLEVKDPTKQCIKTEGDHDIEMPQL